MLTPAEIIAVVDLSPHQKNSVVLIFGVRASKDFKDNSFDNWAYLVL